MADKMPTMGNTSLDGLSGNQTLSDPHPAEIDLLQSAWGVQWRIATAWGSPDFFIGHNQDHGAATWDGSKFVSQFSEFTTPIRVPPYVTFADLAVVVSGRGRYVITTAADTTGTAAEFHTAFFEAPLSMATTVYTAGPLPSSMGSDSGRGIQLVASARPYWQDIDLTVKLRQIDEIGTVEGVGSVATPSKIFGMGIRWIWQPDDITGTINV